jgi:hypothetical protein
MSGKKDEPLFYDDRHEDKKCPPNHPVARSDPNEVGMKNDARLFYEEEKEEVKVGDPPDGHTENESLARNEAWCTAHDLNTRERIDIEDPGASGDGEDWIHATTRPGAQRVDGPGNNGLEDDSFTVIIGGDEDVTIEPSPPTLSAQLVNTEEEINRAVQDFLQNAVVADVVPEVAPDNRGMWWKLAGAVMVVITIAIGVALGISLPKETTSAPTNSPPLSPVTFLRDLLSPISSDGGEALSTPSTPQNMALEGLAVNPNLANYTDQDTIQRYALATLYYCTTGDFWNKHGYWLSNDTEVCNKWYQNETAGDDMAIDCTSDGAVSALELSGNSLEGTIPPEIGMLNDSLGKFTVEE